MNKTFSCIHLDKSETIDGLVAGIHSSLTSNTEGILILIGSKCPINLDLLPGVLSELPVPSVAAVFPGLIFEDSLYDNAVIICGLLSAGQTFVFSNISQPEAQLDKELASQLTDAHISNSAFLAIDGTSPGVDTFVSSLYNYLGPDVKVIGGGSGHHDFSQKGSIITAQGCLSNAALLIFQPEPFVACFRHGWEPVAGPFLITGSEGTTINSINYQPALPFYAKVLKQHSNIDIDEQQFVQAASHYPFGMEQLDSEFLVRDPLQFTADSIECAGDIPTNTMVYILNADTDELINAAEDAAAQLTQELSTRYLTEENNYVFVIDCISRLVVMGEKFPLELKAIRNNLPEKALIIGVLSIGEVTNSSQGTIQFLNKTTVIGGLG